MIYRCDGCKRLYISKRKVWQKKSGGGCTCYLCMIDKFLAMEKQQNRVDKLKKQEAELKKSLESSHKLAMAVLDYMKSHPQEE